MIRTPEISRRHRRAVLLLVLLMCGCGSRSEPAVTTRKMLGTIVSISTYDRRAHVRKAVEEAFEAMGGVGSSMNRFDPGSELSKLNDAAGKGWVEVSPDLLEILDDSILWSERTGGSFDVTVLPIMKLWDFKAADPQAPSKSKVDTVLALTGYAGVGVDSERRRVSLARKGMGIDLGGIAKGYAVDRAASVLRERDVESAMVIGGGNIAFVGLPPGRDSWRIGVRHPRVQGVEIGIVGVASGAVATSGDYERYVVLDGKRYSHILDPRTGWPTSHNVASVTILAATAQEADVLSTAVFVMGAAGGMEFVESQPGVEAVIVTIDESGPPGVNLSSGVRDAYTAL